MPVTNHITFSRARQAVRDTFGRLEEARQQATTGLRVQTPPDDPTVASAILGKKNALRTGEMYQRTLDAAVTRLDTEDDVLADVTNILARAKQLAAGQVGSMANTQTRLATKGEVDQLIEAVIGLGNTQVNGSFLFGGFFSDTRPFDGTGKVSLTEPPVGELQLRIGDEQAMSTSHDGQTIFVDSGVLASLQDLSAALAADDGTLIGDSMTRVDTAIDNVQTLVGEVASRQARADRTRESLRTQSIQLEAGRSRLEDADLSSVVVDLANRQLALESALYATSRAMGVTLLEYLT